LAPTALWPQTIGILHPNGGERELGPSKGRKRAPRCWSGSAFDHAGNSFQPRAAGRQSGLPSLHARRDQLHTGKIYRAGRRLGTETNAGGGNALRQAFMWHARLARGRLALRHVGRKGTSLSSAELFLVFATEEVLRSISSRRIPSDVMRRTRADLVESQDARARRTVQRRRTNRSYFRIAHALRALSDAGAHGHIRIAEDTPAWRPPRRS